MNKEQQKEKFQEKLEECLRQTALMFTPLTESELQERWGPLHKVVPEKWRDGFMYMETGAYYSENEDNPQRSEIVELHDYKHGITRNSLHINKYGQCFCNKFKIKRLAGHPNKYGDEDYIVVEPCSCDKALEMVYKDLELFGATRETKYDEEYKMCRNKALAEAGYTVLGVSPMKVTKTTKGYHIEEEL